MSGNQEESLNDPEKTLARKENFACEPCEVLFSTKFALKRHNIKFHMHDGTTDHTYVQRTEERARVSRLLCPQKNICSESFPTYERLRYHLKEVHLIECEVEHHDFVCLEDFKKWKQEIELQTISQYVSDTAMKLRANNIKKLFDNCHRSHSFPTQGSSKRNLKSTGSNKIGAACPSRMEVSIFNEEVKVQFCKTHCGHELELGSIGLDKDTRTIIAGKLREGVSFGSILDWLRECNTDKENLNPRLAILERKDLHNIMRDYNIGYNTRRHPNDAVSVKLWVEEMKALDNCPVLYYKGQDETDDETILGNSDFALVIMTSFQEEMLQRFGSQKICIDGTHGTNAYDIQLFTLMTIDEYGTGCPVAFCFSNKSDASIFEIFFQKVKSKVGSIQAKVFMSDDAPAFYNAWQSVMCATENRLLCTWHVDKNWRQNLNKVKGGNEKKAATYKICRVLLETVALEDFHKNLEAALAHWREDEDTIDFGHYFNSQYAHRPSLWAYCYRLGLGINCNMYLESFHKNLKHFYLEGRKVKRLDKSINAVLKIARDAAYKRLTMLAKNKHTDKVQAIIRSHKTSASINPDMIQTINENKEWLVTSSKSTFQYIVSLEGGICSELCLSCKICNICLHCYACTCTDYLLKLNICKHIHAIASRTGNVSAPVNSTKRNEEVVRFFNHLENEIQGPHVTRNNTIKQKAELIIGLTESADVSEEDNAQLLTSTWTRLLTYSIKQKLWISKLKKMPMFAQKLISKSDSSATKEREATPRICQGPH